MANTMEDSTILVVAMGNAILDKIIKVNDTYLFEKFNIQTDGSYMITSESWNLLENEIKMRNYKMSVLPGGCSQNTLFVMQRLLPVKFKTLMISYVGEDQEANFLEKELKNAGIESNYIKLDNFKTSHVIGLIHKHSRCFLYTNELIKRLSSGSHLSESDKIFSRIKDCKIFILEAFFIIHSFDLGLQVTKFCRRNNVVTSFNINSESLIRNNADKIIPLVKVCDIVIGNKEEFTELCGVMNLQCNNFRQSITAVHKIMTGDASIPEEYNIKNMRNYVKILIITDGEKSVHCITKCDGIIEFKVPTIRRELIKNTAGAGDVFLGGFLYGILNELPILKCLQIACNEALTVIQKDRYPENTLINEEIFSK